MENLHPTEIRQEEMSSMAEHEHLPTHSHAQIGPVTPHEQQEPYWKRAHKDWRFWVGVVAIAVAIAVYILTLDLSTVPHR